MQVGKMQEACCVTSSAQAHTMHASSGYIHVPHWLLQVPVWANALLVDESFPFICNCAR
jgi:hypothetical protein